MSKKPDSGSDDNRVIRLRPYFYIHVLDSNNNISRVEAGPKTFVKQDHEQIVLQPTSMVNIPPRSYCIVGNPTVRDEAGVPVLDENGLVRLRHGEQEVRLDSEWKNPFPLYPGEFLHTNVTALTVVNPDSAIRILAVRDFDDNGVQRVAGDEWLFKGPGTYIPRIEVTVVDKLVAQVVKPNQALKLKALRQFVDRKGIERKTGEEWLIREQGSYLPDVYEQVVGMVKARVLTEKRALHLAALHSFRDVYGVVRKAGQEWLVTHEQSQTHIPDVHERVIGEVGINTVTRQQYCVVVNPVGADGLPQWGKRELRKGEVNFFLQPGEKLENGIQDVEILGEEEALLLRAREQFEDEAERKIRAPGEEWMIYGPQKYVPPVQVQIVQRRHNIPLDENEGIYVRNKQTGKVFMVTGQTYMLKPKEELWSKVLPKVVEELLVRTGYRGQGAEYEKPKPRVPHKVVTYRVPHNAAVQIYDYKRKRSRVVFGPELVMLEPDEQFTVQSLSGGNPKRANATTSLTLMMGPDFMNDVVVVETSDHARLKLVLSYNWLFEADKENPEQAAMIFSVRDFVGDTCKALASRVRGAVASRTFDDFHKNSSDIIRQAVFGSSSQDENPKLVFSANLLAVTNVDVQSVEPVEQRTRDALQKSVQLAIEISTASQEALANHEAQREEQVAEGRLQKQKIKDQSEAEKERLSLLELKSQTAITAAIGKAKAEAEARLEEALITAKATVGQAAKKAQAQKIRSEARLQQLKMKQTQEIEYKRALDQLEIDKARKEAAIEVKKFSDIVESIGPETIEAIARAGPEMQAKLLEGLGLQGFLVTDGTSPINLFNTASGLIGAS